VSRAAGTVRLFFGTNARTADAEPIQNHLQRTEVGERRLQQVEPDKRGEPEPVRAMVMGEQQADEDECSGEPADNHVHFHTLILGRQRRKSYNSIADFYPDFHWPVFLPMLHRHE
jgi:hypothetical protein